MRSSINKVLMLTVGTSALMTGNASHAAQDDESATLQEVVVTAERREQDVQKIAASVSVRTGDDLQAQGKYSLADILQDVPGVQGGAAATAGVGGGSGTDSPASGVVIRGIVSNLGAGGTITSVGSSAATYVDDIYQGIGGNYDIGRVEIVRGPQGTLYGRSAVSGAVGTFTRNPEFDRFGGFATAEYGGNEVGAQHVQHYAGAVNVPVSDQLAIRFSANRYTQGGIREDHAANQSKQTAGKVKILYKPNDDISLLIGGAVEYNTVYSGSTGVTITQPTADNVVITRSPILSHYPGTNSYRQLWGKLDWNLGFATLTYIPAFRNFRNDQIVNNSTSTNCTTLTNAQLFAIGAICFIQPTKTPFDEFITHELRLASNPDSKLTWQAGGMLYLNNLQNHADNEWQNPQDGNQNAWSDSCTYNPPGACGNTKYIQYADTYKRTAAVGVFAEATYPVTDALRLTGGLRYDYTKVKNNEFFYAHGTPVCLGSAGLYVNLGVLGNPSCKVLADDGVRKFYNLNWKTRVEYDLAPGNMLYATVSTGSSPGDLALSQDINGIPRVLELTSQQLLSYDLGSKNRFFGDKLQANGEIYYQDYGGYQAANVNIGAREPLFTSVIIPVKFYGLDAELLYQLTPQDRFGLNVAYTHGWYVGQSDVLYTIPATTTPPAAARNVTLGEYIYFKTVYGIVPWTSNLTYDHMFNLNGGSKVSLHGDVRYTSSYYPAQLTRDNVVTQGVPPYSHVAAQYVFNTNVTWTAANGKLSLNGYVRNLFDNRYKTGGSNGCSAVTGRCGGATSATVYNPRSYGIVANVNF